MNAIFPSIKTTDYASDKERQIAYEWFEFETIKLNPVKIPPRISMSADASVEEVQRGFEKYKSDLIKLNPYHYNSDGTANNDFQWIRDAFRRLSISQYIDFL